MLGARDARLYCCAADEDQARLLFDDVAGKFQRNPILQPLVDIQRREIRMSATSSRLTLLNADVASSWGLRPDWIAIDEIVEWQKRGLWDSLWSATGKRPRCRVLCISTAGWDKASLGWEVREIARTEADWYFSARGQCASWISKDWLAQQRRTLPAHTFARLHEARWVDGVGAFLTAEEVDACFRDWPAGAGSSPVAIGLDLGLTRDRSVAAVARQVQGLVVVEHLVTWAGRPGAKVELEQVEEEVLALARKLQAPVYYDPYQGVLLAQRLERQGVVMLEYPFTATSRRALFACLLDLIRGRRLRARPHEELRRELLGLEVSETAAGWRVDHKPGRFDDHVVAAALAAQAVAPQEAADFKPEHFMLSTLQSADDAFWDHGDNYRRYSPEEERQIIEESKELNRRAGEAWRKAHNIP